ncbi:Uncharacterised protein [Vibrio cholerae]|nr:Uncharacterised protein [Vibrio cholerae]
MWTCEWWPPPTVICNKKSKMAVSAAIFTTGLMC